jgi:predicted nucleic acid-binding Zn ribbon protein
MNKFCQFHGNVKFAPTKRKNIIKYYQCTQCQKEYVQNKRNQLKKDLVEYKGGKCEKCGYDKCFRALDFHHKNPKDKKFNISAKGLSQSWESLKKEADKCMLICSNCHRELHYELDLLKLKRQDLVGKKRNKKTIKDCKLCGKKTKNNQYCSDECRNICHRKTTRPNKNELIDLLKKYTWVKIGKDYGVSDNAVRRWAKDYNIPLNRKLLK